MSVGLAVFLIGLGCIALVGLCRYLYAVIVYRSFNINYQHQIRSAEKLEQIIWFIKGHEMYLANKYHLFPDEHYKSTEEYQEIVAELSALEDLCPQRCLTWATKETREMTEKSFIEFTDAIQNCRKGSTIWWAFRDKDQFKRLRKQYVERWF